LRVSRRLEDLGAVGSAGHGDPLNREQDIPSDDDLLALDDADAVSSLDPETGGHRIIDHLLHEEPARLRHVEGPSDRPRHPPCAIESLTPCHVAVSVISTPFWFLSSGHAHAAAYGPAGCRENIVAVEVFQFLEVRDRVR